jgi:hypothetical protein
LYQQSSLRFGAATSNNYVALKAPSTVGTSLTWTLPATDGGSGQVLCTDSNGVLGWIPGSPVVTGSVNHILLNDGANGITTARCGTAAFGFALGRLCFPTTNIILGESAFTGSTGCCNTVMGESSMFGSKGSFNTAIGRCVLYGSTGNSNTLIGTNAGRGFSGDNSIGIGSDVFYNSGKLFVGANNFYSNIAVGASAMSNSNRAFCNVGIGILAAAGLSGCDNTAIGSCALCATSGNNNIAIGTCAQINSNTSGGGVNLGTNFAIGACSQSSMCGCCNIGIGCGTQRQLTGNSSVAIGHGAMCLSTMDNSIAIGTNAMRSSTFTLSAGCPSIAIGECALASSTGHTHTAIGSYAMYNSNGCCNIGIGYCAGANHTSGFINAVAIGYNSRFYASNTVKLGNNASITTITGSIVNNSDCRNKTDVRPTIWGLDFINALRPVDYRWDHRSDYADGTPDGSKKGTRFHSGLLAQEVQAAADATGEDFAGVIHWSHNGISQGPEEFGLKYDYFVGPLIRAVQELSVRVCAEEFRRKE